MPTVSGWITQDKFLLRRTPTEMEPLLGVPPGYFSQGVTLLVLLRLPEHDEFELGGYTHWPGGRPVDGKLDPSVPRTPEFVTRHKGFARESWSLTGPERLIKAVPNRPPHPVLSWPVGRGVKQWKLLAPIPALEVARLARDEPYRL